MWSVFETTINFYQASLITYYVNKRCALQKHSFLYDIILIICIGATITLLDTVNIYYLDNLVFLLPIIFSMILRKSHITDVFFWCTLLCIVFSIDSTLASSLVYALTGTNWTQMINSDSFRLFYIISANLFHTVLSVFICNIHRNGSSISFRALLCLFLLLLAQLSAAECFFASQIQAIHSNYFATYGCVGLFFSIVLTVVLYEIMHKESDIRRKLEIEMQTTQLTKAHQEELRTIYSNMLSAQHDLRHRILAAEEILAKNEGSFQDAINMLQNTDVLDEFITGNIGVDAVLAAKSAVMKENSIHFSFYPCPLSNLPLSEQDFVVLLSNILDNAIEAVMRLPISAKSREICLSFSHTWNIFSIACNNHFNPKTIQQRDGIYISSKEQPEIHGYGIRSIKKTVEDTGGLVEFTSDNEKFYVKIMLPMED